MHEARFRADDLGEMRQEGDDVVLDLGFDRVDARDVELGGLALVPDRLGGVLRDDAELGHGVGGMRLDLEPDAELRLRRPDRRHLGAGVARDHRQPCRHSDVSSAGLVPEIQLDWHGSSLIRVGRHKPGHDRKATHAASPRASAAALRIAAILAL